MRFAAEPWVWFSRKYANHTVAVRRAHRASCSKAQRLASYYTLDTDCRHTHNTARCQWPPIEITISTFPLVRLIGVPVAPFLMCWLPRQLRTRGVRRKCACTVRATRCYGCVKKLIHVIGFATGRCGPVGFGALRSHTHSRLSLPWSDWVRSVC